MARLFKKMAKCKKTGPGTDADADRGRPPPAWSSSSLSIPCLPESSPAAPTPAGMAIPLHPHQSRALHRCLLIETDGSLSRGFDALPPGYGEYVSRGGILADAAGTGKTATILALVLTAGYGSTLVVAPGHLVPQWRTEVSKFAPSLEVAVGEEEHRRMGPCGPRRRRVVLVDISSVLSSESEYWDLSRKYAVQKRHGVDGTKKIREAARYCVSSPRGSCSYSGLVYLSSLHMPVVPWRRVVLDEIQDLIEEGTESQKNLLQLTRDASNVWVCSATPFLHGNRSVEANHELLGFKRLRLDAEPAGGGKLPKSHPFERIKAKLYVRSPRSVTDKAIRATGFSVVRETLTVTPLNVEVKFYRAELARAAETCPPANGPDDYFRDAYATLREMTVYPEASPALREFLAKTVSSLSSSSSRADGAPPQEYAKGRVSVDRVAKESLAASEGRLKDLRSGKVHAAINLRYTSSSLELAEKVRGHRQTCQSAGSNPFAIAGRRDGDGVGESATSEASRREEAMWEGEAKVIHDHFCGCGRASGLENIRKCSRANRSAVLCVIRESDRAGHLVGPEFILGSVADVIGHFRGRPLETTCIREGRPVGTKSLDHYIHVTRWTQGFKRVSLTKREKDIEILSTQIEVMSSSRPGVAIIPPDDSSDAPSAASCARLDVSPPAAPAARDPAASEHGSKPAALVNFLRSHPDDAVIVFSMWHDALRHVLHTLRKFKIGCAFCDGGDEETRAALDAFADGSARVLLLGARARASGANLQRASRVVFLDPPGTSADHGAALEEQAVGRAVRMGQEKSVTVTRFCVSGTIEAALYYRIDSASERLAQRANDFDYVIEGVDRKVKWEEFKKDEDIEEIGVETLSSEELRKRRLDVAEASGAVIDVDSVIAARIASSTAAKTPVSKKHKKGKSTDTEQKPVAVKKEKHEHAISNEVDGLASTEPADMEQGHSVPISPENTSLRDPDAHDIIVIE